MPTATEYRSREVADLEKELVELRREEFNLRMQRATGQLANPARFRQLRKDVARIKTIMNEKARLAGAAGE